VRDFLAKLLRQLVDVEVTPTDANGQPVPPPQQRRPSAAASSATGGGRVTYSGGSVAAGAGAIAAAAGGALQGNGGVPDGMTGNGADLGEPVHVEQRRVDETQQVGRNNPCWCGSGKKFKKCHGGHRRRRDASLRLGLASARLAE
jgi:preprotein translocase subunit SecA